MKGKRVALVQHPASKGPSTTHLIPQAFKPVIHHILVTFKHGCTIPPMPKTSSKMGYIVVQATIFKLGTFSWYKADLQYGFSILKAS